MNQMTVYEFSCHLKLFKKRFVNKPNILSAINTQAKPFNAERGKKFHEANYSFYWKKNRSKLFLFPDRPKAVSQILERTIEKRKADDKTPEILEKETRQQQK